MPMPTKLSGTFQVKKSRSGYDHVTGEYNNSAGCEVNKHCAAFIPKPDESVLQMDEVKEPKLEMEKFCVLCQTDFKKETFYEHLIKKHTIQSKTYLANLESYAATDDSTALRVLASAPRLKKRAVKLGWGQWLCQLCGTASRAYSFCDQKPDWDKHLQLGHNILPAQCRRVLTIFHQSSFLLGRADGALPDVPRPLEVPFYYGCRFCGLTVFATVNRLLRHLQKEHAVKSQPARWFLPDYFQGDKKAISMLARFMLKDSSRTTQLCPLCKYEPSVAELYTREQFMEHCRTRHRAINLRWLANLYDSALQTCPEPKETWLALQNSETEVELAGAWMSRGNTKLPITLQVSRWQVGKLNLLTHLKHVCHCCPTILCMNTIWEVVDHLTANHAMTSGYHIVAKLFNGERPSHGDGLFFLCAGDHIRDYLASVRGNDLTEPVRLCHPPKSTYCPLCDETDVYFDTSTLLSHLREKHTIAGMVADELAKCCFSVSNVAPASLDLHTGQVML